jgi:hypothetical protein
MSIKKSGSGDLVTVSKPFIQGQKVEISSKGRFAAANVPQVKFQPFAGIWFK